MKVVYSKINESAYDELGNQSRTPIADSIQSNLSSKYKRVDDKLSTTFNTGVKTPILLRSSTGGAYTYADYINVPNTTPNTRSLKSSTYLLGFRSVEMLLRWIKSAGNIKVELGTKWSVTIDSKLLFQVMQMIASYTGTNDRLMTGVMVGASRLGKMIDQTSVSVKLPSGVRLLKRDSGRMLFISTGSQVAVVTNYKMTDDDEMFITSYIDSGDLPSPDISITECDHDDYDSDDADHESSVNEASVREKAALMYYLSGRSGITSTALNKATRLAYKLPADRCALDLTSDRSKFDALKAARAKDEGAKFITKQVFIYNDEVYFVDRPNINQAIINIDRVIPADSSPIEYDGNQ